MLALCRELSVEVCFLRFWSNSYITVLLSSAPDEGLVCHHQPGDASHVADYDRRRNLLVEEEGRGVFFRRRCPTRNCMNFVCFRLHMNLTGSTGNGQGHH